jgi:crotonobetainyl-CoA:carnitine CoA-transferase CaiB-like acyl-CoA transferase
VLRIPELLNSDHVRTRDAFVPLVIGGQDCRMPGPPFRIDGVFGQSCRAAPAKGEHNSAVYGEVLGMRATELAELHRAGVI